MRSKSNRFLSIICLVLLFFSEKTAAQNIVPFDSLRLKNMQFLADDYGNFYYNDLRNLRFVKTDSSGKITAELMPARPFRVQSVRNPLNIVLFSANAQQLRFVDQNLNDIQPAVNLAEKFGFIVAAYVEDQEYVRLLEETGRRLLRYDIRRGKIVSSVVLETDYDGIVDMVARKDKIYIARTSAVETYSRSGRLLSTAQATALQRLELRNNAVYALSSDKAFRIEEDGTMTAVFEKPGALALALNTRFWVAIVGNKLYLYPVKK